MQIFYSSYFAKQIKKLTPEEKSLLSKFEKKFRQNPFSPDLKTHKLSGKLKNYWACSINYKIIVKKLAENFNASGLIKREKPVEGKKSDPAHPSIYPTGEKQILSGEEEKIYNLIVRRFLSLFCEDAVVDNKKITAIVDGLAFSIKGLAVRKRAWMEIFLENGEIRQNKRNIKRKRK